MRQIVIFAGLLLVSGVLAAHMVDQAAHPQAPPAAAATALAAVPPARQNAPVGTVTVPRDTRGHFVVAARVDGRRMSFMLDTGASLVALRQSDASLLGIHPFARDFNIEVRTANGVTRAARADLGMVEIDGLTVRNVAALVSPDEALSENLLGLSFLSRLRSFSYREGRMVLEQ
jgi:aspartyl protease family protein